MFGLFKKRKPPTPPPIDPDVRMEDAINSIKNKWIALNDKLVFKEGLPLSEIIEVFITPVREYIFSAYPEYYDAPNDLIWIMVFNAVMDSGTHPKSEVNEAVAELEGKYANN